MGKGSATLTLGMIAVICIIFWMLQPEVGMPALVIGALIIVGLFLYLFLGKDYPAG